MVSAARTSVGTHTQTKGAMQAGKAWTTVVCPHQRLFFFVSHVHSVPVWCLEYHSVHIGNIKENDGDHRI